MLQIQLKAVYSELADPAAVAESGLAGWLSGGGSSWRLSCHQLATYRALTRPDGPEVIFNTAMTGDGKSLAGQLPSLVQGWRHKLFAMYPTNELIRDQLRQTQQTWALWGQKPVVAALDSDVLDRRMAGGDFAQRGQALQALLNNHDVVLTNPDIFYYVMHLFYVRTGKVGDAPDRLLGPLVQAFQQFTFDEFHIFDAPQIVGVVNALLLIDEMTRGQRRQFLFQSATPRPLLQESLQRAGFAVEVIDHLGAGFLLSPERRIAGMAAGEQCAPRDGQVGVTDSIPNAERDAMVGEGGARPLICANQRAVVYSLNSPGSIADTGRNIPGAAAIDHQGRRSSRQPHPTSMH